MTKGIVAAIARDRSLLAVRCANESYVVVAFFEDWVPAVGEAIEGDLLIRGLQDIRIGDGSCRLVDIESFNCSVLFAHDRLTK